MNLEWLTQASEADLRQERKNALIRAQQYVDHGALRTAERARRCSQACDMELQRRAVEARL
ncbi:hypothetical protein [Rhodococcus pyridinivorans]|uniref:hypothetical protein n=1 Tax=Rhodococcus pyridinivorans TaxID=103816 RepID=UPI000563749C|nr:hypothetical protein [Rhodococcus pyridinivorans]